MKNEPRYRSALQRDLEASVIHSRRELEAKQDTGDALQTLAAIVEELYDRKFFDALFDVATTIRDALNRIATSLEKQNDGSPKE